MEGYHSRREWTGTPKHLKAMGVHRALAILYGVIAFCVLAAFASREPRSVANFGVPLIFALPAVAHGLIAFGAARANPLAQVLSVLAALLMLLGVPIGTIIGIYLLRNASWEKTNAEA